MICNCGHPKHRHTKEHGYCAEFVPTDDGTPRVMLCKCEGYNDAPDYSALIAAQAQQIAALLEALKKVTDKLDHICTFCDGGFVGNEEWEVIETAQAVIAQARQEG